MALISWDSSLAILCPCFMALAVKSPDTKWYRIGLYAIGVAAAISNVLRLGRATAERKDVSGGLQISRETRAIERQD